MFIFQKTRVDPIFIALPQILRANECELHQLNLIIQFMMKNSYRNIRPDIGQERCEFVKTRVTSHAIYILRMQKDMYLCFVDYQNNWLKTPKINYWNC